MVEIFLFLKQVLHVFGLFQYRDHGDSFYSKYIVSTILNIIVIVSSLLLLLPAVAFIIFDANDSNDIFATLFGIGGSLIVCLGYIAMLYKRSAINRLIFALEDQVNRRMYWEHSVPR